MCYEWVVTLLFVVHSCFKSTTLKRWIFQTQRKNLRWCMQMSWRWWGKWKVRWQHCISLIREAIGFHVNKLCTDILLTVHHSIFISVFNQLDAQNLFHNISCLYVFRAHVLIIRRSKLHYTVSGIITPIGGCLILSQSMHETATYRCDDTRGCVMQFWPPDDEHMCSKHVEAWNKTYCETNFVHQVG